MDFYVVRHSERLDEADEDAWERIIKQQAAAKAAPSSRKLKYFAQDPPITSDRGVHYANTAAETLRSLIATSTLPAKLYCSKMRRAVQTACPIARALNLPIHLSAGLAGVIAGVAKADGAFQFRSLGELRNEVPDVDFVDCDSSLSTENWLLAIEQIVVQCAGTATPIIVGHRETIRGIAGRSLATPYCCIALFRSETLKQSSSHPPGASSNLGRENAAIVEPSRVAPRTPPPARSSLPPARPPSLKQPAKVRGAASYPLVHVLNPDGSVVDQTPKPRSTERKK